MTEGGAPAWPDTATPVSRDRSPPLPSASPPAKRGERGERQQADFLSTLLEAVRLRAATEQPPLYPQSRAHRRCAASGATDARVFVTRELPGERFAALRNDPDLELDIWPGDFPPGRDDLLEHVRGVDGLVCLITDRIDEAVLEAAGPQLKVVSQMAVGVDNVDLAACAARGIPVGNTPGVLTETTADIAFALILVTARRVAEAAEYVRRGDWETWGPQ